MSGTANISPGGTAKTPGGRPPARLCDTGWALVIVSSTLAALASTVPQITVKATILRIYGRGNAFAINGSLESCRALAGWTSWVAGTAVRAQRTCGGPGRALAAVARRIRRLLG